MKSTETVEVFDFRTFDLESRVWRRSKFKATRDTIVSNLGGEVLEGTGRDVPLAELDKHGHYRRIATGWGELS